MKHALKIAPKERLLNAIPFGLTRQKPKHFRDMFRILWDNRDNLPYAWKVLSRGVCDGCALGVAGFEDWTIQGTHLCMTRLNLLRLNTMGGMDPGALANVEALKGKSLKELRGMGRLAYPMLREKGDPGFRRIGWEEANRRMAEKIRGLDPHRLAFFVTARGVTNEVYYMAQKVARYLGTNNVDNAARLCHSPSTGAMKYALGVSASTCSYQDWWDADVVVFFGSNPANDQPVTTKYLHEAKEAGTKIVMVNPYLEPGMKRYWVPSTPTSALFGSALADAWFPVSQGGDIAFIYGVMRWLIENDWVDHEFIAAHTNDFDQIKETAMSMDWAQLEADSGLSKESMREFAEIIGLAKKGVLVWSMGITQHAFGGDAVSMILNLGLMRGFLGRDGSGLMPIRGHSGVQGGAEMGAYSNVFPGGKPIDTANAEALSQAYGFPVPDWVGMTTPEMLDRAEEGDLDFLYSLGGNLLRTMPQPDQVAERLANIPMRVHQDILVTDQMLVEPGETVLLLPAQTRYEQEGGGTETTTERRIAFSPEIPRSVGEAKAEWRILRELACAVDPEADSRLGCATGDEIRKEIAQTVPFYAGIETLSATGDAVQYGGRHLCAGGECPTEDGRARFRVVAAPSRERDEGHLHMGTRRGKQFNTLIYGEIDPLNGAPRDAVLINPEDAKDRSLVHGDRVNVRSAYGEMLATVHLASIARGSIQTHWPESNALLPADRRDSMGGVPDYNAEVALEVYLP